VQAGYSQVRNDNAWAYGNGVIGLRYVSIPLGGDLRTDRRQV
jgi:hypothetical protein